MPPKRPASPSVSPPPPSAPPAPAPSPPAVESTYYFILCHVSPTPDPARPRTRISRCYPTAAEALRFVRDMVRGWEPHIERTWEEFADPHEAEQEAGEEEEEEESKLLLRVTTRYSVSMDDLQQLCSDIAVGEQVAISVQREVVPIFKPLPPPPIPMQEVYVVVQRDFGGGGGAAASTLHGAYADRKKANAEGRRVLRLVGGGLDAVGRIRCRHEESMDEEGLYGGCAYVEEEGRGRVEVGVERLDVA